MYHEKVFISKIVNYARVLENKDCGFGPRKIDFKDHGFLFFTSSSKYDSYALTECHSSQNCHAALILLSFRYVLLFGVPLFRS